ncbi:MAG: transketolase C-terminal domain-containing protein, partial [Chloroflexota bacterium]
NLPVVFAIDRAGVVGGDGKTHQGAFDISYLRHIPNMVVSAPKDEAELLNLLYTGIQAGCPFALRYPRTHTPHPFTATTATALPIGQGEILRKGKDLALVAIGSMVYPALEAAEKLAAEGVETTVVNARFVKPLDSQLLLEVARKTKRMLTLEENALAGGFGSAVLELLASHQVEVKVGCHGLPDHFIEHGDRALLCSLFNLDADGIVHRVQDSFPELFPRGIKGGTAPGIPAIPAGN